MELLARLANTKKEHLIELVAMEAEQTAKPANPRSKVLARKQRASPKHT
jgi:hypothetical protein